MCGHCTQDTYILEAGLNNDVELPYTCRGGICGSACGPVCDCTLRHDTAYSRGVNLG